jgi:dolichyl-phosphate-mannose--protein O-mannosyl transferase
MPGIAELLLAYGAAFGAMNKLPDAVYSRLPAFVLRLLACSYCTGFHTGWMAYLAISHEEVILHHAPLWAFTSGAFSYGVDAVISAVERTSQDRLTDDA